MGVLFGRALGHRATFGIAAAFAAALVAVAATTKETLPAGPTRKPVNPCPSALPLRRTAPWPCRPLPCCNAGRRGAVLPAEGQPGLQPVAAPDEGGGVIILCHFLSLH